MHEQEPLEALRAFATLAQEIAGQSDPVAAASAIVELAVKTVGCDWAALARLRGDRLTFVTGTDSDLLDAVARIARDTGESISGQAGRLRTPVLCNDLTHDRQWPGASSLALRQTPVRAVLAFPLHLQERDLGVLTCYSRTANFFNEERVGLAGVFADHAAIAFSLVQEHHKVQDLNAGLDSNRQTGTAVGIVMAQLQISAALAFNVLRVASQNSNQKLHDIAEDVIHTGQVPLIRRRGQPTPAHPAEKTLPC